MIKENNKNKSNQLTFLDKAWWWVINEETKKKQQRVRIIKKLASLALYNCPFNWLKTDVANKSTLDLCSIASIIHDDDYHLPIAYIHILLVMPRFNFIFKRKEEEEKIIILII